MLRSVNWSIGHHERGRAGGRHRRAYFQNAAARFEGKCSGGNKPVEANAQQLVRRAPVGCIRAETDSIGESHRQGNGNSGEDRCDSSLSACLHIVGLSRLTLCLQSDTASAKRWQGRKRFHMFTRISRALCRKCQPHCDAPNVDPDELTPFGVKAAVRRIPTTKVFEGSEPPWRSGVPAWSRDTPHDVTRKKITDPGSVCMAFDDACAFGPSRSP